MTSPSKELAEIIVNELLSKKLILAKDKEAFQGKLADGSLKADDWKLAIEKTVNNETSK